MELYGQDDEEERSDQGRVIEIMEALWRTMQSAERISSQRGENRQYWAQTSILEAKKIEIVKALNYTKSIENENSFIPKCEMLTEFLPPPTALNIGSDYLVAIPKALTRSLKGAYKFGKKLLVAPIRVGPPLLKVATVSVSWSYYWAVWDSGAISNPQSIQLVERMVVTVGPSPQTVSVTNGATSDFKRDYIGVGSFQ